MPLMLELVTRRRFVSHTEELAFVNEARFGNNLDKNPAKCSYRFRAKLASLTLSSFHASQVSLKGRRIATVEKPI